MYDVSEIQEAIMMLNASFILNEYKEPDFFGFEYRSNAYNDAVYFMDIRIWCNCDDTRDFDDNSLEYESYFDCFKRLALEVIDNLVAVRPALEKLQIWGVL